MRQIFDGRNKLKVGWEKLTGPRQHELVALADSHVRNSGDVRNFARGSLVDGSLKYVIEF